MKHIGYPFICILLIFGCQSSSSPNRIEITESLIPIIALLPLDQPGLSSAWIKEHFEMTEFTPYSFPIEDEFSPFSGVALEDLQFYQSASFVFDKHQDTPMYLVLAEAEPHDDHAVWLVSEKSNGGVQSCRMAHGAFRTPFDTYFWYSRFDKEHIMLYQKHLSVNPMDYSKTETHQVKCVAYSLNDCAEVPPSNPNAY
ncbi:hypothetical protein [Pontibacter sp. G13]|uniref:hypothetical protein n=1 Tax=Pontibacter sp. G13 TaxID=3074898 RepID=UPI0028893188|nr:hypothetical protein [Pontibacter sp. G13]WNJ19103.1 hypothetical protein RJD25_01315 [Pontibacter sp. G13]